MGSHPRSSFFTLRSSLRRRAHGVPLSVVRITSREAAQGAPSPFTTFSLFYDGRFLTHEILSEKKFEKIIADIACK